jgi:hypothetical protein
MRFAPGYPIEKQIAMLESQLRKVRLLLEDEDGDFFAGQSWENWVIEEQDLSDQLEALYMKQRGI